MNFEITSLDPTENSPALWESAYHTAYQRLGREPNSLEVRAEFLGIPYPLDDFSDEEVI